MKEKEKAKRIRAALEAKFADIINLIEKSHSSLFFSELYIQVNKSQKTLSIFDTKKNFYKNIYLEEAIENLEDLDFFYNNAPRLLKEVTINCRGKKLFDQVNFLSSLHLFILDENGKELLKFLLLDSDRAFSEEKLLKDIDRELNSFIKQLLSDLD